MPPPRQRWRLGRLVDLEQSETAWPTRLRVGQEVVDVPALEAREQLSLGGFVVDNALHVKRDALQTYRPDGSH
jgi:hypothetical protein